MPFSTPVPSVINNPLTYTLYGVSPNGSAPISPGASKFIITENSIKIVAETGATLTTEG